MCFSCFMPKKLASFVITKFSYGHKAVFPFLVRTTKFQCITDRVICFLLFCSFLNQHFTEKYHRISVCVCTIHLCLEWKNFSKYLVIYNRHSWFRQCFVIHCYQICATTSPKSISFSHMKCEHNTTSVMLEHVRWYLHQCYVPWVLADGIWSTVKSAWTK